MINLKGFKSSETPSKPNSHEVYMISVFRTSEQELNAFFATRTPRNASRSGGLICHAQIEPMRLPEMARRHSSRRYRRRCAEHLARRRTYRDFN